MITPKHGRAVRAALDLSAQEAAKLCGVALHTLRGFESGRVDTHHRTLQAIQEAYEREGIRFDENGISWGNKKRKSKISAGS